MLALVQPVDLMGTRLDVRSMPQVGAARPGCDARDAARLPVLAWLGDARGRAPARETWAKGEWTDGPLYAVLACERR